MVLKLKLLNGKIKEYPTYWTYYSAEPNIETGYHTKCGLHFSGNLPDTGVCEHLDCALYAPVRETRDYFILFTVITCALIIIALWTKTDISELKANLMIFLFIAGLFLLPLSISNYRNWSELDEYKKHGTIHGIKAYKL